MKSCFIPLQSFPNAYYDTIPYTKSGEPLRLEAHFYATSENWATDSRLGEQ